MSKRAEAAGVVLGFGALAIVVSYPLVRGMASRLPGDLGDPLLTAWTLAWDADRMRHGFRGLWDAPNFFPYRHTLLYSDHLLGVAFFTAPLQWLTGNPVLVYNLAYLASFVLAGGGMYVLAREVTFRRDAALVAGLVYACQPFRVSHLAHLQWLMTGWLPLSLWALHRYFSTGAFRWLLAATAFFVLQSLTAAYFTYFALLPLLVVAGVEVWRTAAPPARVGLHLGAAALITLVAIAPIARAYYDVREQYGMRRTTEEIAQQSADVGDYFSAPPRLPIWGGLGGGRGEHELFPGAATLLLAALGVGSAGRRLNVRRNRLVWLYGVMAALAFILSLGAEPAAWGHRLGVPGPYGVLLRSVPGLDGLRAVARLAVVVQVALAILAAFGVSWLLDRLAPRVRVIALIGLALAVVAEGWAPIPTAAFNAEGPSGGDAADRHAYAYLRTLPGGGVMELPTSVVQFEREFLYQYMTLVHRHPVVNGHSGYVTPLASFLGGGHSPLNEVEHSDAVLAMLRGLGVRYLVIHGREFHDRAVAEGWVAAVSADTSQVIDARRFGETTIAILTPLDPIGGAPDVRLIPPDAIRARASHSADRLAFLFDRDPDTRWLSGGHQRGDEWIELELDQPRNVRVVRLQMASRSFGDYPRELAIESVEQGGVRTLFRGPVLPQFAHGLLSDGRYPKIELILPENQAKVLRLRQLGTTHSFFWSIHELELGETPRAGAASYNPGQ